MKRTATWWLAGFFVTCGSGACKDPGEGEPIVTTQTTMPSSAPGGSAKAAPSSSGLTVMAQEDPTEHAVVITLSKTQLLVGDDVEPVAKLPSDQSTGFSAADKDGANELLLVPLRDALKKYRDADKARQPNGGTSEAIVVADADTSYRVLVEVLYTLGQAEFGRYHLMVLKKAGAEEASPPGVQSARLSDVPSQEPALRALGLVAFISDDGVTLKTSAGSVAAGCEEIGDGITVPKKNGHHDFEELSRCVAIQKKRAPEETSAIVAATADARYHTVIAVMDTLRAARDGDMFPDVRFALPR